MTKNKGAVQTDVNVMADGRVKLLMPSCNLNTVRDGRGGIFTWLPDEPLVEFNMLYFTKDAVRGFHYHPHFVEYLLIVDGNGVYVCRDGDNSKEADEKFVHLAKGTCLRTDINVYHTVYAINEMTAVAMLTKRWEDSDPPVLRMMEHG